ncbi:MAG: hypothetical protein ACK55Z_11165 [bacterium]
MRSRLCRLGQHPRPRRRRRARGPVLRPAGVQGRGRGAAAGDRALSALAR